MSQWQASRNADHQTLPEQRSAPKLTKANLGWSNLRPARKGEPSRNPRGRPKKDLDLAALAQEHAELAIQKLADCLVEPGASWSAKISAASELLDRGFGKAQQHGAIQHELGLSAQFEAYLREVQSKKAVARNVPALIDPQSADRAF